MWLQIFVILLYCICYYLHHGELNLKFDFSRSNVLTCKIIRDINLIEIFGHRRVIDYESMNIQSNVLWLPWIYANVYIHYIKFILLIYEVYVLLLFIVCRTNLKFNFIRLKFYWNYISHILKMLIWYEYFYIDPLLIAKIWKFIQVINSFEK